MVTWGSGVPTFMRDCPYGLSKNIIIPAKTTIGTNARIIEVFLERRLLDLLLFVSSLNNFDNHSPY